MCAIVYELGGLSAFLAPRARVQFEGSLLPMCLSHKDMLSPYVREHTQPWRHSAGDMLPTE
jgi:hypothetical protein